MNTAKNFREWFKANANEYEKLSANAVTLIDAAAQLTEHEPFEAVASLLLSATCVGSAAGMSEQEFMQAVNLAWADAGELRSEQVTARARAKLRQ